MKYRVTLKTVCTMQVDVDADSPAEAKAMARNGDYDPQTEWAPVNYNDLKATEARPA